MFLRAADGDTHAIHRRLRSRWQELREGSPNATLATPVIRICVSGDQKGKDVQGLVDLLLSAAT